MEMFGHDLVKLLNKICECFYSGTRRRLVQRELEFIETDEVLAEMRADSLVVWKERPLFQS